MAIFAISRGYGEMGVFPDVWFVLYVGGASYVPLGCQLLFPAIFSERYIIYNTNSAKLSVIICRRGENR